jgi:hypothetical protein
MVGKLELLDDLERGKIDRCRGPQVRQRVEERARKYEGRARPQQPLAVPEPAAPPLPRYSTTSRTTRRPVLSC